MADLFRRLLGQALQRPHANQPEEREAAVARMDAAPRERAGSRRPAAAGRHADHRRRRGDAAGGRAHAGQGRDPAGRRRALRHHARQHLGTRRARRPRDLALRVEDERRHPHRQPRSRNVARLSLFRHARQLPGVARGQDRQGTVAQGAGQLPAPVLPHHRAGGDRQPRARGVGQRPGHARFPAVVRPRDRRVAVEVVRDAAEGGRPWPRDVEGSGRGRPRRRPSMGAWSLRSRDAALHHRHRQPHAGLHVGRARLR